jgi:hypothetical protein
MVACFQAVEVSKIDRRRRRKFDDKPSATPARSNDFRGDPLPF